MLVKIHSSYREVITICDSDLLGKVFEEKNFQLDIKESFYGGEEKNEEEVLDVIKLMNLEDATFNIVGVESTNAAIKSGVVNKEGIKKIQGIPFALVLL